MKSLPTLAAAAAFSLGFSAPAAAAEPIQYAVVGNWEVNNNGTHCTATATYESGRSLQFNMLANDGAANIAVWNPRWNIPKGNHEVAISIDRGEAGIFRAEANGYYVMMPWQATEAQINLVSNGAVLRATIGSQTFSFRLDGSREMLRVLRRCVASISSYASNPFTSASPKAASDPFAETASNPYRRM